MIPAGYAYSSAGVTCGACEGRMDAMIAKRLWYTRRAKIVCRGLP